MEKKRSSKVWRLEPTWSWRINKRVVNSLLPFIELFQRYIWMNSISIAAFVLFQITLDCSEKDLERTKERGKDSETYCAITT
jgi:hypothetical protein